MPFERYLTTDDHPGHTFYQNQSHAHDCHGQHSCTPENNPHDCHHPHAIQFQIPQFMLDGPPILAPGGGAEVLPAGLLDSGSNPFASCWLTNNGFAPFHSTLISRHLASGSTSNSAGATLYDNFSSNDSQRFPPSFPPGFAMNVNQRQHSLPNSPPSLDAVSTHVASSTASANSFNITPCSLDAISPDSTRTPSLSIMTPSILGLPVYSASGFDVLSILARVLRRPDPTIQLGPVDLSCSFVIVDVRRYDSPIVYASPTFCHLTGYTEQEVLGRNCRFLQSPAGNVVKGENRRFTSPEAVSYMQKLLSSSKECQTTLVNYRKGGQAFINLVTVIPLRGGVHNTPEEPDEVAYHIGFQVDLTEQPNRILDKLRDGSYHNSSWGVGGVSYSAGFPSMNHSLGLPAQSQNIGTKGGRHGQVMSLAVSKELRNLIADTTFTDSIPISTGTNMSGPTNASSGSAEQATIAATPLTMLVMPPSTPVNRISTSGNALHESNLVSISPSLSLLLLEFLPDFLLVLSLKGAFLYVAPSVRLVLGYEPEELVGRSISDVCHPADLVPLMRELKEGSVSGLGITGTGDAGSSSLIPKSVDLLFRALPKVPTFSLSPQSREASAEQGDFQHPSSSGTLHPHNPPGGTSVPYVWLECRGRLHVEPGKGRKAIILSGRARWMPVVQWKSVDQTGGIGYGLHHGEDICGASNVMAGSSLCETSLGEAAGAMSIDPLEFWTLLSTQGTFLVASASVRDVLGWGASEVIGRNLWTMVRGRGSDVRDRVEAELAELQPEGDSVIDPPPTEVTTTLVHKELHLVPVRLIFYRTPRSRKHGAPSTSSIGNALDPLIHPLNNPLCPVVCQATVLSDSEHQSRSQIETGLGHPFSRANAQTEIGGEGNELSTQSPGVSLFEELEAVRESSWQYELQQLKFANQRLHEEVHALEASNEAGAGSCSSIIDSGPITSVSFGHPSTTVAAISISQPTQMADPQLHYTPLTHSTLSTSLPSVRSPNSLHEQDPPSSDWSSLAGANGQATNPLKRSWHSEDSLTA